MTWQDDSLHRDHVKKKCNVFLYFSATTASIASFGAGTAFVWTSPVLPKLTGQLKTDDKPLHKYVSSMEAVWCASLFFLGAAICNIFCAHLAYAWGRKNTLLVSDSFTIGGFLLMAFGDRLVFFLVGRFLCGFGLGSVYAVMPLYLREISDKSNRVTISYFTLVFITLGMLFNFCVGPYVTIRVLSITNAVPLVIFFLVFVFTAPESPYLLVSWGFTDRARTSLMQLRQQDIESVGNELAQICYHVDKTLRNAGGVRDLFVCSKKCNETLYLTIALVTVNAISSIHFILCYLQTIFEVTQTKISSDISTIIVALVLCVSLVIAYAIGFINKYYHLVLSLITTVVLFMVGAYFHLRERDSQVETYFWLPIFGISFYVFAYIMDFGPIPFVMMGEVFPSPQKFWAATWIITLALLLTCSMTILFPFLYWNIGKAYAMFMLASFCCLAGVLNWFLVPPSKRRNLTMTYQVLLDRVVLVED